MSLYAQWWKIRQQNNTNTIIRLLCWNGQKNLTKLTLNWQIVSKTVEHWLNEYSFFVLVWALCTYCIFILIRECCWQKECMLGFSCCMLCVYRIGARIYIYMGCSIWNGCNCINKLQFSIYSVRYARERLQLECAHMCARLRLFVKNSRNLRNISASFTVHLLTNMLQF